MSKIAALALASMLFAAPQDHAQKPRPNDARDMMLALGEGMKGKQLEDAVAAAAQYPLGSEKNPVRENKPGGQREYLGKLRCADGGKPGFERAGNAGEGPFGFIVDLYKVTCPGRPPVDVYIDMYHDGGETRPVPGFTIES